MRLEVVWTRVSEKWNWDSIYIPARSYMHVEFAVGCNLASGDFIMAKSAVINAILFTTMLVTLRYKTNWKADRRATNDKFNAQYFG